MHREPPIPRSGVDLEFVGSLTHDLKSPLAAIMGYAGLLADPAYGPIGEEKVDYTRKILRVADVMLMQINNMVAICRAEANQLRCAMARVTLADLFGELDDTFGFMASQGEVSLRFECPPGLAVMADELRLKLVLQNLIHNAVRHTPTRGRITVAARLPGAGRVPIDVFNSGSYIPEDVQVRLFHVFGRVLPHQEGPGLGLFLAARIVEAHGGHIHVESERGHGTSVAFDVAQAPGSELESITDLSMLPTPIDALAEPAVVVDDTDRPRGRVLLVGDHSGSAALAVATLMAEGHVVERVASGLEGLQRARPMQADVILVYDNLPDLTQADFAHGLRTDPATAAIPLVLMSATAVTRPRDFAYVVRLPLTTGAPGDAVAAALRTARS